MNYGSLYAFLTAIGFKINTLTVRSLQEQGAPPIETYTIYRYALIPAVLWSLLFVRKTDLLLVLHSPRLLIFFGVIIVFWNLQAYLRAKTMNSTNSMALFSTIYNVMVFPLFLGFGAFFDHDKPNLLSFSAVLVLMFALLIRPTPHRDNTRPRLSQPLLLLVALIFFIACCDTILQGLAREALKQLPPTVFLGMFSVPTLAACWLISAFGIRRGQDAPPAAAMQQRLLAVALIPVTWFVASIPEAFSLAAIPIYVFISINVATFLMDMASDIIHKRLHFSLQTASFVLTVVIGIALSVASV